jgi:hypothetical protein
MISHGSRTWPFAATITGTIAIGPGLVTWFGGGSDPQDDGSTASGVNTKGNPGLMACALPMTDAGSDATQGSPIPHLDWFQAVKFTNLDNGKTLVVPLIDDGPGIGADRIPGKPHIGDLTVAAFEFLGGDIAVGVIRASIEILDSKMGNPLTAPTPVPA